MNPSVEEKDIKAGTALELPYWLAESLSSGRHPLVAAELPKVYREAYREILKADPTAVELQKFGLHFYEFGMYIRKFDNSGDVTNILGKVGSFNIRLSDFKYYGIRLRYRRFKIISTINPIYYY